MNNESSNKNNYWFKRRRYGYGFTPSTWQGWFIIILYLFILLLGAVAFVGENKNEQAIYFLIFILLTSALIRISYKKGPKPKWRWGQKVNDNPKEDF